MSTPNTPSASPKMERPIYKKGDIVWTKLGSSWWPGEVKNQDELPSDLNSDFKKPPLVVVKFFDEDSYEYVKNWTHIYPYNCDKKVEFIKKGMAAFRSKAAHMEKFPKDVAQAEEITGGNPNILSDSVFLPPKKFNYSELFTTPSPNPKKLKSTSSTRKSFNKNSMLVSHRRFLGHDDYKAFICVQYPGKYSLCDDEEGKKSFEEDEGETMECKSCGFATKRLGVMMIHAKMHINSAHKKKPKPARKKKDIKKKDIFSDLLEEWSDDDRDETKENNLELKERVSEKKPPRTYSKKSKKEYLEEKSWEDSDLIDFLKTDQKNEKAGSKKKDKSGETSKSTKVSSDTQEDIKNCFDFDEEEEDEDIVLATTPGRKIPRVIPEKTKSPRTEELQHTLEDDTTDINRDEFLRTSQTFNKGDDKSTDNLEDIFKEVMEETALPQVERLINNFKPEQNFHDGRTVKKPDKCGPSESETGRFASPKKKFVESFEDFELEVNKQKEILHHVDQSLNQTELLTKSDQVKEPGQNIDTCASGELNAFQKDKCSITNDSSETQEDMSQDIRSIEDKSFLKIKEDDLKSSSRSTRHTRYQYTEINVDIAKKSTGSNPKLSKTSKMGKKLDISTGLADEKTAVLIKEKTELDTFAIALQKNLAEDTSKGITCSQVQANINQSIEETKLKSTTRGQKCEVKEQVTEKGDIVQKVMKESLTLPVGDAEKMEELITDTSVDISNIQGEVGNLDKSKILDNAKSKRVTRSPKAKEQVSAKQHKKPSESEDVSINPSAEKFENTLHLGIATATAIESRSDVSGENQVDENQTMEETKTKRTTRSRKSETKEQSLDKGSKKLTEKEDKMQKGCETSICPPAEESENKKDLIFGTLADLCTQDVDGTSQVVIMSKRPTRARKSEAKELIPPKENKKSAEKEDTTHKVGEPTEESIKILCSQDIGGDSQVDKTQIIEKAVTKRTTRSRKSEAKEQILAKESKKTTEIEMMQKVGEANIILPAAELEGLKDIVIDTVVDIPCSQEVDAGCDVDGNQIMEETKSKRTLRGRKSEGKEHILAKDTKKSSAEESEKVRKIDTAVEIPSSEPLGGDIQGNDNQMMEEKQTKRTLRGRKSEAKEQIPTKEGKEFADLEDTMQKVGETSLLLPAEKSEHITNLVEVITAESLSSQDIGGGTQVDEIQMTEKTKSKITTRGRKSEAKEQTPVKEGNKYTENQNTTSKVVEESITTPAEGSENVVYLAKGTSLEIPSSQDFCGGSQVDEDRITEETKIKRTKRTRKSESESKEGGIQKVVEEGINSTNEELKLRRSTRYNLKPSEKPEQETLSQAKDVLVSEETKVIYTECQSDEEIFEKLDQSDSDIEISLKVADTSLIDNERLKSRTSTIKEPKSTEDVNEQPANECRRSTRHQQIDTEPEIQTLQRSRSRSNENKTEIVEEKVLKRRTRHKESAEKEKLVKEDDKTAIISRHSEKQLEIEAHIEEKIRQDEIISETDKVHSEHTQVEDEKSKRKTGPNKVQEEAESEKASQVDEKKSRRHTRHSQKEFEEEFLIKEKSCENQEIYKKSEVESPEIEKNKLKRHTRHSDREEIEAKPELAVSEPALGGKSDEKSPKEQKKRGRGRPRLSVLPQSSSEFVIEQAKQQTDVDVSKSEKSQSIDPQPLKIEEIKSKDNMPTETVQNQVYTETPKTEESMSSKTEEFNSKSKSKKFESEDLQVVSQKSKKQLSLEVSKTEENQSVKPLSLELKTQSLQVVCGTVEEKSGAEVPAIEESHSVEPLSSIIKEKSKRNTNKTETEPVHVVSEVKKQLDSEVPKIEEYESGERLSLKIDEIEENKQKSDSESIVTSEKNDKRSDTESVQSRQTTRHSDKEKGSDTQLSTGTYKHTDKVRGIDEIETAAKSLVKDKKSKIKDEHSTDKETANIESVSTTKSSVQMITEVDKTSHSEVPKIDVLEAKEKKSKQRTGHAESQVSDNKEVSISKVQSSKTPEKVDKRKTKRKVFLQMEADAEREKLETFIQNKAQDTHAEEKLQSRRKTKHTDLVENEHLEFEDSSSKTKDKRPTRRESSAESKKKRVKKEEPKLEPQHTLRERRARTTYSEEEKILQKVLKESAEEAMRIEAQKAKEKDNREKKDKKDTNKESPEKDKTEGARELRRRTTKVSEEDRIFEQVLRESAEEARILAEQKAKEREESESRFEKEIKTEKEKYKQEKFAEINIHEPLPEPKKRVRKSRWDSGPSDKSQSPEKIKGITLGVVIDTKQKSSNYKDIEDLKENTKSEETSYVDTKHKSNPQKDSEDVELDTKPEKRSYIISTEQTLSPSTKIKDLKEDKKSEEKSCVESKQKSSPQKDVKLDAKPEKRSFDIGIEQKLSQNKIIEYLKEDTKSEEISYGIDTKQKSIQQKDAEDVKPDAKPEKISFVIATKHKLRQSKEGDVLKQDAKSKKCVNVIDTKQRSSQPKREGSKEDKELKCRDLILDTESFKESLKNIEVKHVVVQPVIFEEEKVIQNDSSKEFVKLPILGEEKITPKDGTSKDTVYSTTKIEKDLTVLPQNEEASELDNRNNKNIENPGQICDNLKSSVYDFPFDISEIPLPPGEPEKFSKKSVEIFISEMPPLDQIPLPEPSTSSISTKQEPTPKLSNIFLKESVPPKKGRWSRRNSHPKKDVEALIPSKDKDTVVSQEKSKNDAFAPLNFDDTEIILPPKKSRRVTESNSLLEDDFSFREEDTSLSLRKNINDALNFLIEDTASPQRKFIPTNSNDALMSLDDKIIDDFTPSIDISMQEETTKKSSDSQKGVPPKKKKLDMHLDNLEVEKGSLPAQKEEIPQPPKKKLQKFYENSQFFEKSWSSEMPLMSPLVKKKSFAFQEGLSGVNQVQIEEVNAALPSKSNVSNITEPVDDISSFLLKTSKKNDLEELIETQKTEVVNSYEGKDKRESDILSKDEDTAPVVKQIEIIPKNAIVEELIVNEDKVEISQHKIEEIVLRGEVTEQIETENKKIDSLETSIQEIIPQEAKVVEIQMPEEVVFDTPIDMSVETEMITSDIPVVENIQETVINKRLFAEENQNFITLPSGKPSRSVNKKLLAPLVKSEVIIEPKMSKQESLPNLELSTHLEEIVTKAPEVNLFSASTFRQPNLDQRDLAEKEPTIKVTKEETLSLKALEQPNVELSSMLALEKDPSIKITEKLKERKLSASIFEHPNVEMKEVFTTEKEPIIGVPSSSKTVEAETLKSGKKHQTSIPSKIKYVIGKTKPDMLKSLVKGKILTKVNELENIVATTHENKVPIQLRTEVVKDSNKGKLVIKVTESKSSKSTIRPTVSLTPDLAKRQDEQLSPYIEEEQVVMGTKPNVIPDPPTEAEMVEIEENLIQTISQKELVDAQVTITPEQVISEKKPAGLGNLLTMTDFSESSNSSIELPEKKSERGTEFSINAMTKPLDSKSPKCANTYGRMELLDILEGNSNSNSSTSSIEQFKKSFDKHELNTVVEGFQDFEESIPCSAIVLNKKEVPQLAESPTIKESPKLLERLSHPKKVVIQSDIKVKEAGKTVKVTPKPPPTQPQPRIMIKSKLQGASIVKSPSRKPIILSEQIIRPATIPSASAVTAPIPQATVSALKRPFEDIEDVEQPFIITKSARIESPEGSEEEIRDYTPKKKQTKARANILQHSIINPQGKLLKTPVTQLQLATTQPKTVPTQPKAGPTQFKTVPAQPKTLPVQAKTVANQLKAVSFLPKTVPAQPKTAPAKPQIVSTQPPKLSTTQAQLLATRKTQLLTTTTQPQLATIHPTSTQSDEVMFDINSMPIVLSDEILTPESIEQMPMVISDEIISTSSTPATQKSSTTVAKDKLVPKAPPQKQPSLAIMSSVVMPKSMNQPSVALMAGVATQKTTLGSLTALSSASQIVVADNKPKSKLGGSTSTLSKLPVAAGLLTTPGNKSAKYLLVSSNAAGQAVHQKIVGSVKQTTVGKPASTVSSLQLSKATQSGVVTTDPTNGSKIMIVTNQQGEAHRLLLTPAQQKMLGMQGQPVKETKTIVKGPIPKGLLSEALPSTSGLAPLSPTVTIASQPQQKVLTPLTTTQSQITGVSQVPRTGISISVPTSRGHRLTPNKKYPAKSGKQKTILIKNQLGQTVKKIQGTDDDELDRQVAEQLAAIKASAMLQAQEAAMHRAQEVVTQRTAAPTSPKPGIKLTPKRTPPKKIETVKPKLAQPGTQPHTQLAQKLLDGITNATPGLSPLGTQKTQAEPQPMLRKTLPEKPLVEPLKTAKEEKPVPSSSQQIAQPSPPVKPEPSSPLPNLSATSNLSTAAAESSKNPDRPLQQLVIQDAMGNQTTITEGQILALPSETVDGQPQSYMLITLDESGNLTPLNNEALMSLDPSLGLGGDISNMVLQVDQGQGVLAAASAVANKSDVAAAPIITDQQKVAERIKGPVIEPKELNKPEPARKPGLKAPHTSKTLQKPHITPEGVQKPSETVQLPPNLAPAALEAHPNLAPAALEAHSPLLPELHVSLGEPPSGDPSQGQQLIVTGDPTITQKFLESLSDGSTDLASILAADGGSLLIQIDGQQILIRTNSQPDSVTLMPSESSEGDSNPIFSPQHKPNRDILAAALANTDVFQGQDSPTSVINKEGLLPPGAELSPNSTGGTLYPMHVGSVLETSLTLSSPIMTPLEAPSIPNKKILDEADILNQIPKNVDLPITITDPNIAQTVAHPPAGLIELSLPPLADLTCISTAGSQILSSHSSSLKPRSAEAVRSSSSKLTEISELTNLPYISTHNTETELPELTGSPYISTSCETVSSVTHGENSQENVKLTGVSECAQQLKAYNGNMPLLTDDMGEETGAKKKEDVKSFGVVCEENKEDLAITETTTSSTDSLLDAGLCTLGGAMCSSLSEPPPDMFELPEKEEEITSDQSNSVPEAETLSLNSDGSGEIPLQPQIVAKLSDIKRLGEESGDSSDTYGAKRAKYD